MDRAQKKELVSELHEVFDSTEAVVVTHYIGLSVAEISDLRQQMREAGARFRVTKNRLTKLALEGTKCDPISHLFTGPTGIAYADDPVAPAKVAVEFAKKNEKLKILGGMMGEQELDYDGVKALADLPSLDELRAKIVGMINTPATRVAGVMQAPAGQLARVFGAYGQSDAA
ncbi:MAG: 50S ribosomal protein L10 [Alphaproteobacteria bacterium]|nr:50S ribosomal protein L10 [Alphaproteobacteria bacterium]